MLDIAYLHLVDHESLGSPAMPHAFPSALREAFTTLANPDLLERFVEGIPLATPDPATFYTPGALGYTDYAVAAAGAH